MRKMAFLLALVLTGCASHKAYVPTGDGLADVTRPAEQPTEPEITAPGGLNTSQGGFTLAYYPRDSFNPYDCTNINNRMLFSLLYQSLFAVDSEYNVEPQLCKSFTVTENLQTYVFTLEQATFADGTVLNAADVVESLDAAGDSATVANFPLWFLYRLTVILGVEPDMSTYMRGRVLNLREGVFRQPLLVGGMRGEVTDSKGTFVTADASRMLSVLSRAGAGDLRRLRMTSVQRQRAIDVALDYLSAHLTALPRLKTLDVLRAVLR